MPIQTERGDQPSLFTPSSTTDIPAGEGPHRGGAPVTVEDLEPVETLVPAFADIRAFIAANGVGLTRDDAILEELSKLLHAKVFDESQPRLRFVARHGDSAETVFERIVALYLSSLNGEADGIDSAVALRLDPTCVAYAVRALQHVRLTGAGRDVVGEAYETLIFPALRGGQGQFFTPKNVGTCMASLLEVQTGERVLDPACGPGGFLAEVYADADARGQRPTLLGIDKDDLLVRLATDSLRARGIPATVASANSLAPFDMLSGKASKILAPGSVDVIITNPPFGSKIPVSGEETLQQFELAQKWTFSKRRDSWVPKEGTRRASLPPQILFVERCWQLLREGGRCAIVLPEGVLGNKSTGYVRQWLVERADILAVVDCPLETFLPSTSTKTTILVFRKTSTPDRPAVFMAVADTCGHDRRGRPLIGDNGEIDDDFVRIAEAWQAREHHT